MPTYPIHANHSFEASPDRFTLWSTAGDVDAIASLYPVFFSPTDGYVMARLTATGAGYQTVAQLETFLDLPTGAINIPGQLEPHTVPWCGSAIKTTFTATAGQVLSFDWGFYTQKLDPTWYNPNNDGMPVTGFNDFAVWYVTPYPVVGSPTLTEVCSFNTLASFEQTMMTGTELSAYFSVTGTYQIGLAVINVTSEYDSSPSPGDSQLGIDYFRLIEDNEIEDLDRPILLRALLGRTDRAAFVQSRSQILRAVLGHTSQTARGELARALILRAVLGEDDDANLDNMHEPAWINILARLGRTDVQTQSELARALTLLAQLGRTDTAARSELARALVLLAQMGRTDLQAMIESRSQIVLAQLGRTDATATPSGEQTALTVLAQAGRTDTQAHLQPLAGITVLAQLSRTDTAARLQPLAGLTIRAQMGMTDAQVGAGVESPGLTLLAVLGESHTDHMVSDILAQTPITLLAVLGVSDRADYYVNRRLTIYAIVSKDSNEVQGHNIQGYTETGLGLTLLALWSMTDLHIVGYDETGLGLTILAVMDDTDTYVPASGNAVQTSAILVECDSERGCVVVWYAIGTTVYRRYSQDGGDSWSASDVVTGLSGTELMDVTHDSRKGSFAMVVQSDGDGRVCESYDVGETWTEVLT